MLKVGLPYDYGSSAFVCLVPKTALRLANGR
jgi:hypothetical protein